MYNWSTAELLIALCVPTPWPCQATAETEEKQILYNLPLPNLLSVQKKHFRKWPHAQDTQYDSRERIIVWYLDGNEHSEQVGRADVEAGADSTEVFELVYSYCSWTVTRSDSCLGSPLLRTHNMAADYKFV